MTDRVLAMSTAEWQRWKLGPSLQRESKWMLVGLHPITLAARKLAEKLADLGPTLARVAAAFAALDVGADQ